METSLHLSDSFSYGWLKCKKPSSEERLDDSLGHSFNTLDGGSSSFIDMDPEFFSMRWTSDFDFGLPGSRSPLLVHADQIFCNGHLLPCQLNSNDLREDELVVHDSSDDPVLFFGRSLSEKGLLHESSAFAVQPVSSSSSPLFYSAQSTPASMSSCSSTRSGKAKLPFVRSCRGSPRKILLRYLCFFLMPLYKKVKALRLFSSKSKVSAMSSARRTASFSSIEWCHGNADTAVDDAILYCKKSIGQDI